MPAHNDHGREGMTEQLTTPARRRRVSLARRQSRLYWAMLAPALVLGGSLILYPMYLALDVSFSDVGMVTLDALGEAERTLDNYTKLWQDSRVRESLLLALVYTFGATIPAFVLGLVTALLLNKRFPGRRILRTLVLLPWAVPTVLAAIAFLWILDASYGVLNYVLKSLGIINENIAWLASTDTSMIAVILPTVWKIYPFFTLIILAALQAVPGDLYEAASVDGAGALRQFWSITWPVIRPACWLSIILQGLWTFREFDIIYPMTGGGPADSTNTLAIKVYNEAFNQFNMGFASALGILTMVVGAIAIIVFYPKLRQQAF